LQLTVRHKSYSTMSLEGDSGATCVFNVSISRNLRAGEKGIGKGGIGNLHLSQDKTEGRSSKEKKPHWEGKKRFGTVKVSPDQTMSPGTKGKRKKYDKALSRQKEWKKGREGRNTGNAKAGGGPSRSYSDLLEALDTRQDQKDSQKKGGEKDIGDGGSESGNGVEEDGGHEKNVALKHCKVR